MLEKIQQYLQEAESFNAGTPDAIEAFRVDFMGKKGKLTLLFDAFKLVPGAEKRELGQMLNTLKNKVQERIDALRATMDNPAAPQTETDLSRPAYSYSIGAHHPISLVRNEMVAIFARMGFTIAEGPEIEDDWHVFSSLNFAPEHPARDMQDTFFIDTERSYLLRTHTSSVQVRTMQNQKPPIRVIAPGRVFRNEAISARSHCMFHQIEGLYIDHNVSFADLRQVLLHFSREFFGRDTQIRLRPSYFPFTEPSAEMDVSCKLCGGKGCNVCKYTGWLEILGCGMVHPNVLDNCGIDSKEYTGYAFGLGLERIAMSKFGISDIRLLFENDVRVLRQFANV